MRFDVKNVQIGQKLTELRIFGFWLSFIDCRARSARARARTTTTTDGRANFKEWYEKEEEEDDDDDDDEEDSTHY